MASTASSLTVQPGAAPARAGTITSLTAALQQASPGTILQLTPGTYNQATGETFPLVVPDGVTIWSSHHDPEGVVIQGGGQWTAPGIGPVAVAMVLSGDSQLQGITLSYPQGTGLWVSAGRPQIRHCRIVGCGQDGLRGVGQAIPIVIESDFQEIQASGMRLGEQAKGDIRRCRFSQCGTGIRVSGQAAPLLVASQVHDNQVGLEIADTAQPVLRQMHIQHNRTLGLWLQDEAHPDLGHPQSEGENVIRHNGEADIRHESKQPLLAVGNDLLPQGLSGRVTLGASQVPATAAVAALDQASSSRPTPSPSPAPTPRSYTTPFPDLRGHWAAPFCDGLAQRGLIQGFPDGSFRPDRPVTRAQFAALVSSSFAARPTTQAASTFIDVAADFWAVEAIRQAQQREFLSGYPDGSFRPEAPIQRGQGIVAIANGLQLPAAPANQLHIYRDRVQIPSYAATAIAAATQQRLVVNYPDPLQLRPLATMTRADVAALVYQGLVVQGRAPVIASDFIVRPDTTQVSFADLNGHWGEPFIRALIQRNWIRGFEDGSFRPDEPMTRAQYAALLGQAFDLAPQRSAQTFVDVPSGHWAAAAIQQTYRAGFLSGFPDTTFAPQHGLVRVQTWVSLVSGLRLTPEPSATDPLAPFTDAQDVPTYARGATQKAIQLGLVTNPPDRPQLRPNQVASRADIAAAVHQALVAQQRLPAIASPHIVTP